HSAHSSTVSASGSAGYATWAWPPEWNSVSSRGPHQGHGISSIFPLPPRGGGSGRGGSMGHRGRPVLVDQGAGREPLQREGGVQRMRRVVGDRVRIGPAGGGGRLEAAGAPAAVEVQVSDRREAEDGGGVRNLYLN